MKVKRNNLTSELSDFEIYTTPKKNLSLIINYDSIISKQAQAVQSLHKECAYLRQQLNRMKTQQKISQTTNGSETNIQNFTEVIEHQLLKQFAGILQLQANQISKQKVLQTIKRIKWERQKRVQPIFIERIKEVRIPITIQTIVEKPIIIYKTQYVQKIVQRVVQKIVEVQKLVQVPVFQEKVIQKFIQNTKSQITNQNAQLYQRKKVIGQSKEVENQHQLKQAQTNKKNGIYPENIGFKSQKLTIQIAQKPSSIDNKQFLNKTSLTRNSNESTLNKSFGNKGYSPKYKEKQSTDNDPYFKKDDNYNKSRRGSWNKSQKDYKNQYSDKYDVWKKQDNYKETKYSNKGDELANKNIKRRTRQDRDFEWEKRR